MPNPERLNNNTANTAETNNETPRPVYRGRGDKANRSAMEGAKAERPKISDLSLEDLLNIDETALSDSELAEVQARLEEEERAKELLIAQLKEQAAAESTPEPAESAEAPVAEPSPAEAPATVPESAPVSSAIPEPELKDTSGLDVPASDPEFIHSLENPDDDEVDPAAATIPMAPPVYRGEVDPTEAIPPAEAMATFEKAKRSSGLREFFSKTSNKIIAGVMAAVIMAGSVFGAVSAFNAAQPEDQPQQPAIEQVADDDGSRDGDDFLSQISDIEAGQDQAVQDGDQVSEQAKTHESSLLSGELSNGTSYDYSEYADRDHKESYNAFGYDASDCFGDIEKSKAGIMKKATENPEALAAYAYGFFNEAEKAELGISGMTATDIDDYISNSPDGGAMQKRLLSAFEQGLNDESTGYNFYYENDTEQTDYIYFVDDNNDGIMDPSEMHLAYDTKDRNGAPQLDISRDGGKVLDLNLSCGWQTNYEPGHAPDGVPYVPSDGVTDQGDPGTGSEGTGSEGTGSEGTGSEGTGSEDTGSEGTGSEDTGSEGTGSEGNEDTGSEDTGDEGTGSEDTGEETTGSEDTGEEDTGSEDTGEEDTGDEGTGSEDTGEEDTGSEDTGEEDTGSEDTGEEDTGSEDTGEEDTGSEDTGEEDTGEEGTGDEGTGEETTGDEGTDIEQKDYGNMERIDNQILEDIADDIGTDEVRVTPTDEVSQEDLTEQPAADDYQGTEAEIAQNEPSQEAEPVQEQISDVNDYSQDQGGAHADEYAPVQANDEAQAAADQAEIPVDQAPTGEDEVNDIIGDLGIN